MSVLDGWKYAERVAAGKLTTGALARQTCERALRDYDREPSDDFPYTFSEARADAVLSFVGLCRHSKGQWAGSPFELEPWQIFSLSQVFGWVHVETNYRRFRSGYIEVPRKNGKTTLLAPVGLYMLAGDHEAGAEVYSAATKRDQARLVFDEARNMVKRSPELAGLIGNYRDSLVVEADAAKFVPVGADADTLDGLNSHCNLIDELHAHKSGMVYDTLETGMGARRQPLQMAITTAGSNRFGICYLQRTYLQNLLKNIYQDERYWGIVYTVDEEDDWREEDVWIKANPNWGVSVLPDDMRRLATKAKAMPTQQNAFLTKRLNVWTTQEVRWLDLDEWDASGRKFDEAEFGARPCFGGLDLSQKLDLTAFVVVAPPTADHNDWLVMCRFWVPEDNIEARVRTDRVPYDVWSKTGALIATPGNVIDYNWIETEIVDLTKRLNILEIGFDPWNATQTAINLQGEGCNMVEMRQGFATMAQPSKELEALVKGGKLSHNGHPVLRWCASNVAVRVDPNGNYMPCKKSSTERVDGVVALIMALGRVLVHQEAPARQSIYNLTALI